MKVEDIEKGMKLIIISNKYNMVNRDIIGIVEKTPTHWQHVWVRYFDPNTGEMDENGILSGEFVVKEFMSVNLEKPTAKECARLTRHYKRLTLEFAELYKEIKG